MARIGDNLLARERRLHRMVSVLTLAVAGLLSSVGFGLHGWLGCTHSCAARAAATPVAKSETPLPAIESRGRCELCDLLAQYRFVHVSPPQAVHQPACEPELSWAEAPELSGRLLQWPAPRGPPS